MTTIEALQVLIDTRQTHQIVITNQGSAREWPKLTDDPLDFHFLPSAMGMAVPFGLGLALARPDSEVLVITGDGSLLMNMGTLVTVTGSHATNISIILLDNGVYAVTGGQKTAAASASVDFGGMATACGFRTVSVFSESRAWRDGSKAVFSRPGPRFVQLTVDPEHHPLDPGRLAPIRQRLAQFQKALDL